MSCVAFGGSQTISFGIGEVESVSPLPPSSDIPQSTNTKKLYRYDHLKELEIKSGSRIDFATRASSTPRRREDEHGGENKHSVNGRLPYSVTHREMIEDHRKTPRSPNNYSTDTTAFGENGNGKYDGLGLTAKKSIPAKTQHQNNRGNIDNRYHIFTEDSECPDYVENRRNNTNQQQQQQQTFNNNFSRSIAVPSHPSRHSIQNSNRALSLSKYNSQNGERAITSNVDTNYINSRKPVSTVSTATRKKDKNEEIIRLQNKMAKLQNKVELMQKKVRHLQKEM